VLCCLEAATALELGDRAVLERARGRLLPAAGELAGAGSGLVTVGPVDRWLAHINAALATDLHDSATTATTDTFVL
jgi:hypothetical protein